MKECGPSGFALAPLPKVASAKVVSPPPASDERDKVAPKALQSPGPSKAGNSGADALNKSDIAEDIEYDDDFEDLADADDDAVPAGRSEESSAGQGERLSLIVLIQTLVRQRSGPLPKPQPPDDSLRAITEPPRPLPPLAFPAAFVHPPHDGRCT